MDQAQDHEFGGRAAIVCLGKIIETAVTEGMLGRPPHRRALLSFGLRPDPCRKPPRFVLSGEISSPIDLPSGCHLHQRCPWAVDACQRAYPPLETVSRGRAAACFRIGEMA
jgi:peptide/nickel transport system ATP-binding protein